MELGQQFLFFFSSLGVFNGFLMGLYFLTMAKPRRMQHQFFGLLLLMLSLRIGKSVLYYFHTDLSQTILQVGLSACFFIGPFLFFYIRSVQRQQQKVEKREWIYLLAALVCILTIGLIFPYAHRPDLWNPEIVQGIYAFWFLHVVASAYLIRDVFSQVFSKNHVLSIQQKWLLIVFGTNALMCLIFNSIFYFGVPSYIFGPITFSFVFYGLLAFLIFFPESRTLIKGEKKRYLNKKISQEKARELNVKLQELMLDKKRYVNQSLKLKDVADDLHVSQHILSQYLNDNLQKSFTDFVNEYRVDAACQLLQSQHHLTVEAIGAEVGFRSKTSFYAAFKKHQGITPAQFSKQAQVL